MIALSSGCGGGETEATVPVAHETPEDQILRVGKVWQANWVDSGFRSPPSPIGVFETHVTSRITLAKGSRTAQETLEVDDKFKLTSGAEYLCKATAKIPVGVAFGAHAEEAAVEIQRPALQLARQCNQPGFPEPSVAIPPARGRFVLRGDQLEPFAPPTERREYLPIE